MLKTHRRMRTTIPANFRAIELIVLELSFLKAGKCSYEKITTLVYYGIHLETWTGTNQPSTKQANIYKS